MNNNHNNKENIVLHDIFDIRGGGERLALSLTQVLDSDLAFGKYSSNSFELSKHFNNKVYDLGLKIEFAGFKTWALSKLFANKTSFLKNYNSIIYSGIICPLAIHNNLSARNYYYCHTPPRFVYDKYDYYLNQQGFIQNIPLKLLVSWFKPKYEESIAFMDLVIANSEFVRKRIRKYLKRDSVVVFPPCPTKKFYNNPSQGYYLSTARFDKLKRVDKIIEAFKKMPSKKLVICSSGSEENALKKLANGLENVEFTGQVSESKLQELIANSIATIYIPEDEDFGISPVESMAAGKPVVCSDHGGPIETVLDEETGYYVDNNSITNSLIGIVNKLDANTAQRMKSSCQNRAEKFSEEQFQKKIKHYTSG